MSRRPRPRIARSLVPGTWYALLRGPRRLPVLFATARQARENRDPDEYMVPVRVTRSRKARR